MTWLDVFEIFLVHVLLIVLVVVLFFALFLSAGNTSPAGIASW